MEHVAPAQLIGVLMTGMGNDGAAGDGAACTPRAAGRSPRPRRPPSSGACPASWSRRAARTGSCPCRRSPAGCANWRPDMPLIRKPVRRSCRPAAAAALAARHERRALGGGARGGRTARRRGRCSPRRFAARATRACARRSSPAWRASRRRRAPRPSCPICGPTTPACAPAPSTPCARCPGRGRPSAAPAARSRCRRAPAELRARARPAGERSQPAAVRPARPETEANVCAAAVEVLAEIGGPEALPALARCASVSRRSVPRLRIKVAIDRIGAPPPAPRD